jgi:hypothetical protein
MTERAASGPWQEARKARFLELQARFLHLPPLSAAELRPSTSITR